MDGLYISPEGDLFSTFKNSHKEKTHKIAVAQFSAPNFLERASGNVFHETEKSGNYVLGRAHEGDFARIIAGRLEKSSVDLLSEEINIKQAELEIKALMHRFEQ